MMQQRQQAFTLIELMVVMAIMTVIFSLIGPLAQNQVDKVRASEELHKLVLLLDKIADKAFFEGESISLKIESRKLLFFYRGKPQVYEFVYLELPVTDFFVNGNGYYSIDRLELNVGPVSKVISLNDNPKKE